MTLVPQQPKKEKIFCYVCQKPIQGARTVIEGKWHCADCTYKHDHPDKEVPEKVKRTRAKPYDGPTLFEATGYIKPKRKRSHADD